MNKYAHNYKFTRVFLYITCNRNILVIGEFTLKIHNLG
jgi:hypothetical protein